MSRAGLRPERDSASEAQQQLKTTDSTSRQRGRPTPKPVNLKKLVKNEGGNLVAAPLTPRKTGRLIFSRNITLTLIGNTAFISSPIVVSMHYYGNVFNQPFRSNGRLQSIIHVVVSRRRFSCISLTSLFEFRA
jgi:hypothetical protein